MSETPSQLDAFLSSGAQPEAADTPAPEQSKAAPEAAPTKAAPATKEPAKAAPEPDDDTEPGEPAPHEAIVPRTAYEQERKRRQDWKSRADKAETERDMLAKQLEAAKAPPPQSTPPPPPEPIDPVKDPEGYTRRMRGVVLNLKRAA